MVHTDRVLVKTSTDNSRCQTEREYNSKVILILHETPPGAKRPPTHG